MQRIRRLKPIDVISRAVSSCPPVSVDWRGMEPDDAVGDINEEYLDDFGQINDVALVGYMVCCSEWLYHFLFRHFTSPIARNFEDFIIANWVWLCCLPRKLPPYYDLSFAKALPSRDENVVAVQFVLDSIWDGVLSIPSRDTFLDAALTTQICDFVLPADCRFSKWRKSVLQRLRQRFPSDKTDSRLVQVSRRFYDTEIDLGEISDADDCAALLGYALEGNRYLPLTEVEE